jgi:hypothetical protein
MLVKMINWMSSKLGMKVPWFSNPRQIRKRE